MRSAMAIERKDPQEAEAQPGFLAPAAVDLRAAQSHLRAGYGEGGAAGHGTGILGWHRVGFYGQVVERRDHEIRHRPFQAPELTGRRGPMLPDRRNGHWPRPPVEISWIALSIYAISD